ncbi:MAG TPA: YCF48-related protein, partial [Chloroflexota bacterium]|nr:YCF48-related protein [Chloroflexota bacterium]
MTTAARRLRIVAAAIFLTLAAFVPATAAGSHNWMTQKSGVAATLNDVSCASVIDCYAVGQSGVIITTHNGGATWSKIQNPFSGTGQGLSSIRCGSAGHCAVVIRPNLVMTTANAGKIWQIHIIKFPSTISQVNRVACPAANTCYITLAPSGNPFSWFSHSGAMYKTTNGGLTWS